MKKNGRVYLLRLKKESKWTPYPGMHLYILEFLTDGELISDFRTNTCEYTHAMNYDAESAALDRFAEWISKLHKDPEKFFASQKIRQKERHTIPATDEKKRFDAVIIQASPRPDGNSSAFAEWSKKAIESLNKTAYVIYPDDLLLHPCIGCYQCYNYGRCTFSDDMDDIISLVSSASLVIICTPVYTNTVPASLKTVFDRFLSYHADCCLKGYTNHPKGLLFASAGREGLCNFDSLIPVCDAFMDIAGIKKAGSILCDNTDTTGDIRGRPGLSERVQSLVKSALAEKYAKNPELS